MLEIGLGRPLTGLTQTLYICILTAATAIVTQKSVIQKKKQLHKKQLYKKKKVATQKGDRKGYLSLQFFF